MKIKNLFMYLAACAVAFTSCSKEDRPDTGGEEENYNLFLKFEGLSGTKAETNPVTDGTDAIFTSGRMYFVKQGGEIVRTVEIANTPGAITPAELEAGKLFEDVDKDVYEVHVIGNHDFGTANYNDINDVKDLTVEYLSQSASTFGVENANLYGSGLVQPAGTNSAKATAAGADKEAVFNVAPLLARLEIGQFIGGTNIEKFTIEGIYIHNFYEKMGITGALAASPDDSPWRVSTLQDWTKYAPLPSGEYKIAYEKYLYDEMNATSDPSTITVDPASGKLWAYNVLANAGAEPHIVVKLKNVELAVGSTLGNNNTPNLFKNTKGGQDGEAYLTITGYKTATGSNDGRTSITGGNVYKMSAIRFMDSDLGETPYPDDELLKLWVEVTIKKWEVIPVAPIFNN